MNTPPTTLLWQYVQYRNNISLIWPSICGSMNLYFKPENRANKLNYWDLQFIKLWKFTELSWWISFCHNLVKKSVQIVVGRVVWSPPSISVVNSNINHWVVCVIPFRTWHVDFTEWELARGSSCWCLSWKASRRSLHWCSFIRYIILFSGCLVTV